MSYQYSKKAPSDCEAQCPDCGATLSRLADMNRHRKTKHPDGTETKIPCPWVGCRYKTMQSGNLKVHLKAKHSPRPQYPCQDCEQPFSDGAARIRHRKKVHGYVPYHTPEYLARQARNMQERVVEGANEDVSNKSRRQLAARTAPDGLPIASSSAPLPPNVPGIPYHDNFWKELVNYAQACAPKSQHSHDVPLTLPIATMPGYDTPNDIQPFYMQPEAQPSPTLSDFDTTDFSDFVASMPAIQPSSMQPVAQPPLPPSDLDTFDFSDFDASMPGYGAIQPSSVQPEAQPPLTPSDFDTNHTIDLSDFVATMPGYDAIQPSSMQPEAPLHPSLTPSDLTFDYSNFLGLQIEASTLSQGQGQAFGEFTADHFMPYNGL